MAKKDAQNSFTSAQKIIEGFLKKYLSKLSLINQLIRKHINKFTKLEIKLKNTKNKKSFVWGQFIMLISHLTEILSI